MRLLVLIVYTERIIESCKLIIKDFKFNAYLTMYILKLCWRKESNSNGIYLYFDKLQMITFYLFPEGINA